jgi:lysophospholipase L1-like esterase
MRKTIIAALLPAALLAGCATHAQPTSSSAGSSGSVLVKGKTLRIMALGDSITRGSGSGYGNYRRPLQFLLTRTGYLYQFVGTSTELSLNYHGSDPEQTFQPYQPQHEGYGGFRIDQISADTPAKDDGGVSYPGLTQALGMDKPDVALILLGTNDVNQAFDPGGPGYGGGTGFAADAAGRLDALLDRLYQLSPGITAVVGKITPLADPAKEVQVRAYDALIPQIVAAHQKAGQHVLLADMESAVPEGDLSPDGVHPGTRGYDKMARVWYSALTGQTPPPLPAVKPPVSGPGRIGASNVFTPAAHVAVSSTFAGAALSGARLVDGTPKAFVFGDIKNERVSISGFTGRITRLRFFDAPSYTGRTPASVTIYSSPNVQTSLRPSDYAEIGTFPLPVVGDAYESQTLPAAHPDAGDPVAHPRAVIGFCDLGGLAIPACTKSLLLDFSKSDGYGDGLSEIQAFAH